MKCHRYEYKNTSVCVGWFEPWSLVRQCISVWYRRCVMDRNVYTTFALDMTIFRTHLLKFNLWAYSFSFFSIYLLQWTTCMSHFSTRKKRHLWGGIGRWGVFFLFQNSPCIFVAFELFWCMVQEKVNFLRTKINHILMIWNGNCKELVSCTALVWPVPHHLSSCCNS